jgi:hypothetical protein
MKKIIVKSCSDCKFNTNNIQNEICSVVTVFAEGYNLEIDYNTCLIGDYYINTANYNFNTPRNCPLENE